MTTTDKAPSETDATPKPLNNEQEAILSVMRRWRREGAHYTSDLAHGARLSTAVTRRTLQALEKAGKVKKVVVGNPTSWELADDL